MCLLYVLGHEDTLMTDGSMPESESLDSLREMMNIVAVNRWRNRPRPDSFSTNRLKLSRPTFLE